jgi:hypothetical protein
MNERVSASYVCIDAPMDVRVSASYVCIDAPMVCRRRRRHGGCARDRQLERQRARHALHACTLAGICCVRSACASREFRCICKLMHCTSIRVHARNACTSCIGIVKVCGRRRLQSAYTSRPAAEPVYQVSQRLGESCKNYNPLSTSLMRLCARSLA